MKKIILAVLVLCILLSVAAFGEAGYQQITQEEAARIIKEETGYIT